MVVASLRRGVGFSPEAGAPKGLNGAGDARRSRWCRRWLGL